MGKGQHKAMELLVDEVKDCLLPIITNLYSAYDMFKALENMFEIKNTSRILTLENQLSNIKMNKGETITSYFMRITVLRNQLSRIGHIYDSKELTITLNRLLISSKNFGQGISDHSKLPKFD